MYTSEKVPLDRKIHFYVTKLFCFGNLVVVAVCDAVCVFVVEWTLPETNQNTSVLFFLKRHAVVSLLLGYLR